MILNFLKFEDKAQFLSKLVFMLLSRLDCFNFFALAMCSAVHDTSFPRKLDLCRVLV